MARENTKGSTEDSGLDPNAWMMTFGDLVTLLLTFFVLLITMSSMDDRQFKEAFGMIIAPPELALQGGGGQFVPPPKLPLAMVPPAQRRLRTERDVIITFEDQLKKESLDGIKVFPTDKGVVLKIDEWVLFQPQQAQLTPEATEVLDSLIPIMDRIDLNMIVEGYADETPLSPDSGFDNHMQLSSQRALVVLEYLLENSAVKQSQISCRVLGSGGSDDDLPEDGSRRCVQIVIDTQLTTISVR